ncbi:MAG: hypothetical protein ABIG42_02250 [bacterium]
MSIEKNKLETYRGLSPLLRYTQMAIRVLILTFILSILSVGCAWENIDPTVNDENRFWEIQMVMEGGINTNLYYIIVFNFSGDENQKPLAALSGEDRGKFWDVYYMYGKPGDRPEIATEPLDFYKGLGANVKSGGILPIATDEKKRRKDPTKPVSDINPLDELPDLFREQLEYIDARVISSPIVEGGPSIPNNTIYMKFNWRGFPQFPEIVNINMIVSSLGVDELSNNPDWDIEAIVWDSFAYNGVSIDINDREVYLEEEYLVEVPAADQIVPGRPPSANIVDWSLKITE